MKTTNIQLKEVSVEAMLNDTQNASYNPALWKEAVHRYAKYQKVQFYIVPKDAVYSYDRFYVSYVADGIYFFSKWSAFSSCLTNNSFCKAFIIDGVVYKQLFKFNDGVEAGIANNKQGRDFIRKQISANNIMVSNCI